MIYKFTEVLNDLVNYFILGDILLLESWKRANNLSDDLATEFTTNESGDRAFSEGIVIPMSGIENYPYGRIFQTPTLNAPDTRSVSTTAATPSAALTSCLPSTWA